MRARVRLYGRTAGYLWRDRDGVTGFQYDPEYVDKALPALSASLPLRYEPWEGSTLPAYFAGLVSEGWLRRIQAWQQHIDENDAFSLLIHNGDDLPGAITIELQAMSGPDSVRA